MSPEPRIFIPGRGAREYEWTVEAFRQWHADHPDRNAEEFLLAAYGGEVWVVPERALARPSPSYPIPRTWADGYVDHPPPSLDPFQLPWAWATHAVQIRLAQSEAKYHSGRWLYNQPSVRYRPEMLMRPASQAQARFWTDLARSTDVLAVVSTNYDLRTERTIGASPRPTSPGFYYGGLTARVQRISSPYRRARARPTQPTGSVPLLKLHGSLNWSDVDGELVVYPDLRAVWRAQGTAAIVPPLPEKETPDWLREVWQCAAQTLRQAHRWIVVGYSMPPYDHAMRKLLRDAAADGQLETIELHDPFSSSLADRYAEIAPWAQIVCRPGLAESQPSDSPAPEVSPQRSRAATRTSTSECLVK